MLLVNNIKIKNIMIVNNIKKGVYFRTDKKDKKDKKERQNHKNGTKHGDKFSGKKEYLHWCKIKNTLTPLTL